MQTLVEKLRKLKTLYQLGVERAILKFKENYVLDETIFDCIIVCELVCAKCMNARQPRNGNADHTLENMIMQLYEEMIQLSLRSAGLVQSFQDVHNNKFSETRDDVLTREKQNASIRIYFIITRLFSSFRVFGKNFDLILGKEFRLEFDTSETLIKQTPSHSTMFM